MVKQLDSHATRYTIFTHSQKLRSSYSSSNIFMPDDDLKRHSNLDSSISTPENSESTIDEYSEADIFKFTSNNRLALQQHLELLADIAKDSNFASYQPELQKKVEYYYRSYKRILYLDAVYGDNYQNKLLYAHKEAQKTKENVRKESVKSKISEDFLNLIYMFFHTSMLQKFLNMLNKYRVTVIFYRFTWISFWSLAEKAGWLNNDGYLGGINIDQDALRDVGFVFLVYSLIIYGLRLLMMMALAFKHVVFPTDEEKCRDTLQRIYLEIKKRWYFFINDTAKELITFMILFPNFFNVASCYIPVLTGCLVLLDLIKSCYRLITEIVNYRQMMRELDAQATDLNGASNNQDKEIVSLMQKKLELQHLEKMSKLTLSLITNIIMLTGFIAVSIVAPYAIIPALLLCCTVVRVMDVTSDKFGSFMRARKEYMEKPCDSNAQSRDAKLHDLRISFLKNLLVPMLLVGLLVISWQLALVVTAAYLCVEYSQATAKPKDSDMVEDAFLACTPR